MECLRSCALSFSATTSPSRSVFANENKMAQAEGCCSCKRNRKCPKKSRIPIESAAKFIARSISNVVRLSKSKVFCEKVLNQAGVCDLSELSGVVDQKLLGLLNPNAKAEIPPVNTLLAQSNDAIEKDGGAEEAICLSPSLLRDSTSFSFPTGASYGRLSPEAVTIESDDEDEKLKTCPSPSFLRDSTSFSFPTGASYGRLSPEAVTIESDDEDEKMKTSPSPSLLRDSSSFSFPTGVSYGRLSPGTVIIESDDEDDKMETCPSPSLLYHGDTSTLSADSSEDWLPFDSSPQLREWIAKTVDMIDSQIENDQCDSSQSLLEESPSSLLEDSCDISQDLYDVWLPDDTPPDSDWISVTIDLIDNEVGDDKMRSSSPSLLRESCFMDSDYLSTDNPLWH